MKIKEAVIVEGRDDTAAVKKSVDAVTIETHGYGITGETWELIEKAYKDKGIIVFTDPDYAGEQIRRRIMKRFPCAGEAFLDRNDADRNGDIGIENASPQSIRDALKKARCTAENDEEGAGYSIEDLQKAGLLGQTDSAERRRRLGKSLGIGYCNGKRLLQRLNGFGISREEFDKALREI